MPRSRAVPLPGDTFVSTCPATLMTDVAERGVIVSVCTVFSASLMIAKPSAVKTWTVCPTDPSPPEGASIHSVW